MNELKTVNCEQLMTIPLKSIEFFVDGIISTGLFILAGAPKIEKSWLALDICLSVSFDLRYHRRKLFFAFLSGFGVYVM